MADVSRNEAIHLARLTKKNLEYIRRAFKRGEDVHVVTQLATSLLSLVILPREQYLEKNIWGCKLDDLAKEHWPQWTITLDQAKPKTSTLGHLTRHVRNASAHGRITFSSDSRYLSDVVITVEDAPQGKPVNWRAKINGKDLYSFCLRFVEYIEERLG